MTDIPVAQINVVKSHGGLSVLEGQGAGWLPLCMAIDMPPFDDNKVRQAFRLIVDRNAMLQQVLSGHGRVANDLYSPFDPAFDSSLQRHQDIDKAKSLLKQAGKENHAVFHRSGQPPEDRQRRYQNGRHQHFRDMAQPPGRPAQPAQAEGGG